MDVIKRSGSVQEYDPQKITGAMRKAFASVSQACDDAVLADMLAQVERAMGDGARTVEAIQDEVERTLMANGFYDAAKSYILYRQKRSEKRAVRRALTDAVGGPGPGGLPAWDRARLPPGGVRPDHAQRQVFRFPQGRHEPRRSALRAGESGSGAHHPAGAEVGVHRGAAA